jgi:hypothetical protein
LQTAKVDVNVKAQWPAKRIKKSWRCLQLTAYGVVGHDQSKELSEDSAGAKRVGISLVRTLWSRPVVRASFSFLTGRDGKEAVSRKKEMF